MCLQARQDPLHQPSSHSLHCPRSTLQYTGAGKAMLPTDDHGLGWDPHTQKGSFGTARSGDALAPGADTEEISNAINLLFCCGPRGGERTSATDTLGLLGSGIAFSMGGSVEEGVAGFSYLSTPGSGLSAAEEHSTVADGSATTPPPEHDRFPTTELLEREASDHVPPMRRRVPIVVLGDADVGKSAFVKRYCHREYLEEPPFFKGVVVDVMSTDVRIGGETVTLQFHDVTQSVFDYPEELRSEHEESLAAAKAVLLVCDVTRLNESLERCVAWHDAAMAHSNAPTVLIASKADAARLTTEQSAFLDDFCLHHGIYSWCCSSAAKDFGIEEPVNDILTLLGFLEHEAPGDIDTAAFDPPPAPGALPALDKQTKTNVLTL